MWKNVLVRIFCAIVILEFVVAVAWSTAIHPTPAASTQQAPALTD